MNDKELADRIVALWVGDYHIDNMPDYLYSLDNTPFSAEQFVRDWRVAGALMEKCFCMTATHFSERPHKAIAGWQATACMETGMTSVVNGSDSLPRAINEACVEALEG